MTPGVQSPVIKPETRYILRLEHDPDVDSPCSEAGWKLYSFLSRHANTRDPDDFFKGSFAKPKGQYGRKVIQGLFYLLDYFEHGDGAWSLRNEGMQCQWDTSRGAGVLVWEEPAKNMGAKTPEDRAKDARAFLEVYNDWANGNCYYYLIEDEESGEIVESCGGFIGEQHLIDSLREFLPGYVTKENTQIEGDCAWIVDYHPVFADKEK